MIQFHDPRVVMKIEAKTLKIIEMEQYKIPSRRAGNQLRQRFKLKILDWRVI